MEKVMTVEEKIRRAEEIYQRRKQGESRPVAKVNVNNKKDIKLIKKMIIQMLICVAIYLIIYTIQNNQYVFSQDFINKANEILSYDTNFIEIYDMVKSKIMNIVNNEQNNSGVDKEAMGGAEEQTSFEKQINEEKQENKETNANIEGQEENMQEQQTLPQGEQDIQDIKNTTSFIKPIEGVISSKYGYRETATGSVPKNHTGVDIATNLGTKVKSATDGEVVLDSDKGDYRKTSKNSNRKSKYNLCTL